DTPAEQAVLFPELRIEPLYFNPFYAFWHVSNGKTDLYLDAKTGERYPLDKADMKQVRTETKLKLDDALPKTITETVRLNSFDPFTRVYWMLGGATDYKDLQEVKETLAKGTRITLTVELFEGRITLALPLIGWQAWDVAEP